MAVKWSEQTQQEIEELFNKYCSNPLSKEAVYTTDGVKYIVANRRSTDLVAVQSAHDKPEYVKSWIPVSEVPEEFLRCRQIGWKTVKFAFPGRDDIYGQTIRSNNNARNLFLYHIDYITCAIDDIRPSVYPSQSGGISVLRGHTKEVNLIYAAQFEVFGKMYSPKIDCRNKGSKEVSFARPTGVFVHYTKAKKMIQDIVGDKWYYFLPGESPPGIENEK